MKLRQSIRRLVAAIEPGTPAEREQVGAFWCDDCSIRVPVTDPAEAEGDRSCPDCGEAMRFERTLESGHCAC